MYDLVLKGGRIYDGSGMPSFIGDVAVVRGEIVEIGRVNGGARRTLNVDGLALAPGFIDPHTHLDAQLFWDPLGTSSCFHGVTSVVVGNCGLSLAPAKPEDREAVIKSFVRVEAISRRVLEEGFEWKWTSTKEYLDVLGTRLGINVATLVGHIAVRHYVMGEDAVEREATPEEIAQMQRLVRQGMESGAVGFSTNQNPRHMREDKKPVASRLASKEELGSLLDVLGEMNTGVVQLSGGGADARGRISYAAELARRTGRPVLWQSISHSWSRPNHWQEMLDNTERVFREEGLPIYAMTQAKPFQNRYTLLDAQCFDEFPPGRRPCLTPWKDAKGRSPIRMCEKSCARKRSRTDHPRFFREGGMLFLSTTSSSPRISRLRGSRWTRLPKHRIKMAWITFWIYPSRKISRPASCIRTPREILRRCVKFSSIRLS